ncbi:MAG: Transcriptional regulator, ArsR family [Myxococcales bacterium]|nr:Transcriptional regulator, ArsR family [Myxococcales bacterium]
MAAEPLHQAALDALGDANRRAILEILAGGPRSVQQIADQLPVSRPAVSRHLRLLKNAGLVVDEPVGVRRLYALRADGVEAIRAYFEQVWGDAAARFRLAAENTTTSERPDG